MSKSKEYRAFAEECDLNAVAARHADVKLNFQKLARRWREMEIQAALKER
jgi:hypothetical protein